MKKAPETPSVSRADRTIGQLVADTLRAYGAHFWQSLAMGIPVAGLLVTQAALDNVGAAVIVLVLGSVLTGIAYVAALAIALPAPVDRRRLVPAVLLATVIFLPMWLLTQFYVLPAVAWFALFGFSVPAVAVERFAVPEAVRRGLSLARADFVHALGSLATLVLLVFLTATAMFLAVRAGSGEVALIAAFLALVVTSPILFIGSALLYEDQHARAEARRAVESAES